MTSLIPDATSNLFMSSYDLKKLKAQYEKVRIYFNISVLLSNKKNQDAVMIKHQKKVIIFCCFRDYLTFFSQISFFKNLYFLVAFYLILEMGYLIKVSIQLSLYGFKVTVIIKTEVKEIMQIFQSFFHPP